VTFGKRALDLAGGLAGLLLLWPALLGIALAIKLDSAGPVFFRQTRIGEGGTPFRIWKFRTMREASGTPITIGEDSRITRVGRWLRRYRLDELPQFLNLIAGEMSLVGPRPEVPPFVATYSPAELEILRYRPGMTDPASLRFQNEAAMLAAMPDPIRGYRNQILPLKLATSLEYARGATTASDIGVLLATLRTLIVNSSGRAPLAAASHHDSSEVASDARVH
jgi:lipopolysaccharide/colanic/teichoic acid biosynthesis glycosyltransferase